MSTEHPITPPPGLVQEWYDASRGSPCEHELATQAARWGADAELEACCEVLAERSFVGQATILREWRRPKPPSLAEEGLEALDGIANPLGLLDSKVAAIHTALKRLQELENNG